MSGLTFLMQNHDKKNHFLSYTIKIWENEKNNSFLMNFLKVRETEMGVATLSADCIFWTLNLLKKLGFNEIYNRIIFHKKCLNQKVN